MRQWEDAKTVDIHVVPAVIALATAALAGLLYKRETAAITLAVVAFVAGVTAIDPYREKAINTPAPCVQDSNCTSTGTTEWLMAIAVMLLALLVAGLLGSGIHKMLHRTQTVGSRHLNSDNIVWRPTRPGRDRNHRR